MDQSFFTSKIHSGKQVNKVEMGTMSLVYLPFCKLIVITNSAIPPQISSF